MNTPPFRPERVLRPREQVEHQMRDAILSGEFKVGDRLPSEADLAKAFGVSRSTVREALHALKTSGLISTTPGATGGSFVEGVDHHSLAERFGEAVANVVQVGSLTYAEVADVRRMLEIPCARLAAQHRTPEHIRRLREVIQNEKTVTVSDPQVPGLNAEFHQILAEATGNRMLVALVSALHHVTRPLAYIETSPELGRESVIQHVQIAAAIDAGDEGAAIEAMESHLDYLREHVVSAGQAPVATPARDPLGAAPDGLRSAPPVESQRS